MNCRTHNPWAVSSRVETCGSLQAAWFHPLNGTLQEVRDISGVWKANRTTESEAARVLVGRDTNEARWAVLSACDTGVGEINTGEGVFGLRRAFQVAGARTSS